MEKRDPMTQEAQKLLAPLRPVPPPDRERWQESRQAYLAEIDETSKQAVTFVPDSRRKEWTLRWKQLLSFRFKEAWMATALKALLVLALITGGSAGTVRAAQQSLPGSPLYHLKTQIENWQLESAPNPEAQLEQAMTMAQHRVEEAQKMAEQDQAIPPMVAANYERHLGTALQAAEGITEPLKLRAREQISLTLGNHLRVMEQIQAKQQTNGPDEDHDPIQAMIQAMVHTRAQVRNEEAPGPGPVAPGHEPGSGAGHEYGYGEAPPNEEENGYGYGDPPADDETGHGHGEAPPSEDSGYGHGDPPVDNDKGNPDTGNEPPTDHGNPDNGNNGGSDNGGSDNGGNGGNGQQNGGSNGSGNGGGNP